MLAPLDELQISEGAMPVSSGRRSEESEGGARTSAEEVQDLRHTLKASRERLRRNAQRSTKRIAALCQELSELSACCSIYRSRLADLESGVAMVELGSKLMRLARENDAATRRVWILERTIEAAHAESARLAQERDTLARELHLSKSQRGNKALRS